jgi:hypothetical protein
MHLTRRRRPSPTLAVALLALSISLAGTSYAAITIGSAQIVNNSVRSVDLKNNEIASADVKNGSLRALDFKSGELRRGPAGAPGADGTPGATGATGQTGPAGFSSSSVDIMYAHVDDTANIDAGRTTAGISVAQTMLDNFLVYCFDLPQPASNISATVEQSTAPTGGGSYGFVVGPTNATLDPTQITSYGCGAGTDAAVLVPRRPMGPFTPVYVTFLH